MMNLQSDDLCVRGKFRFFPDARSTAASVFVGRDRVHQSI